MLNNEVKQFFGHVTALIKLRPFKLLGGFSVKNDGKFGLNDEQRRDKRIIQGTIYP